MTDSEDKTTNEDAKARTGSRICRERAAELVRTVRGASEEPFGALRLVRAVIRPEKREPG